MDQVRHRLVYSGVSARDGQTVLQPETHKLHHLWMLMGNLFSEYNFMDDVDARGFLADDELGSWEHIPDIVAGDPNEDYEPDSPVESVHEGACGPMVTGPGKVEYSWQQCALASVSKRVKLLQNKLLWEQNPFSVIFRTGDGWQGADLSEIFQPAACGALAISASGQR